MKFISFRSDRLVRNPRPSSSFSPWFRPVSFSTPTRT